MISRRVFEMKVINIRKLHYPFFILLLFGFQSQASEDWSKYILEIEDQVEMTFLGKKYVNSSPLNSVKKLDREQGFILKFISLNQTGTVNEILNSLWGPQERKKVLNQYNKEQYFSKNRTYFNSIISSKLLFVVKYGIFFTFFVEHEVNGYGNLKIAYPVTEVKGKYYMTNLQQTMEFHSNFSRQIAELINEIWMVK